MWEIIFNILQSLFDTILPRKERVVRIDAYTLDDLRVELVEHEACGVHITTLMSYRTQAVDDLIRTLKYDRAEHASNLLAEALAEYLREEISSLKAFSAKSIVLIPVPLHKNRLRERGFNQIQRALEKLPNKFKDGTVSRVVSDALIRTRDTPQQTRLSRKERLTNVADAFSLAKPEAVRNAHVILVDDVTTTGATLAEAARPFEKADIAISLLALAHA